MNGKDVHVITQVGIVLKDKSSRAASAMQPLVKYLEKSSIGYYVIPSREGEITGELLEKIPSTDICISLGGDGTLLFASRVFSQYNVPIVGINLGGLGFITEFMESEVIECVECFLRGDFHLDERMMIDVWIERKGVQVYGASGLNDLVISSGGISRLIQLQVSSGDRMIGTYRADGINAKAVQAPRTGARSAPPCVCEYPRLTFTSTITA